MDAQGHTALTRVDFYGDALEVIPKDGRLWVVVRPICQGIGMDPDGQRVKLQKEPWAVTDEITATGADGKSYKMFCVDLESLPMWLAGIKSGKVKAEIRPKLVRYQTECKKTLAEKFLGTPAAAPPMDPLDLVIQQSQQIVAGCCPK